MAFAQLVSALILSSLFLTVTPTEVPESVTNEIKELFKTGQAPKNLAKDLENFRMPRLFREGMENTYEHPVICFFCNLLVDLAIGERRLGASREVLAKEIEFICVHLGIESERVCTGVIDLNIDVFLYIVDNYPNLDSHRVCGSVLQSLGCSPGDNFEWSIELPSGSSPVRPKPNDTLDSFKILQLSDIHYDPNYKPYGNADCGEPICCQTDQGEPSSPENTCGYWTDYREADVPWHLIEETVRQAKTQVKLSVNYTSLHGLYTVLTNSVEFEYVYYTGDIISHRVWETSIRNNSQSISDLFTYFKQSFDVPVYPVFGNHEPHPLDLWPTESVKDEKFSVQWLFELVSGPWSELVGQDISETVLKGGYYTVSPKPGFRIIAINGNLCYTYNWWLIFNDVDPYGQLQWLTETLLEAEKNNESVHILSHVPSGTSESLSVWGREYSRIIERFANTITGQFNGHTHRDQFHVYYNSSNPTQPIGTAFNGASVTPYTASNPSYKIYDVDSTTFDLLDYEEWTFNLTLANSKSSNESPDWYKLYSFTEAFGVDNLSPVEVDKVLYKMAENHSLLDDYFLFKFRNGDAGIKDGCDDKCKKDNLCEIATTVYGVDVHCNRFTDLYDKGQ